MQELRVFPYLFVGEADQRGRDADRIVCAGSRKSDGHRSHHLGALFIVNREAALSGQSKFLAEPGAGCDRRSGERGEIFWEQGVYLLPGALSQHCFAHSGGVGG